MSKNRRPAFGKESQLLVISYSLLDLAAWKTDKLQTYFRKSGFTPFAFDLIPYTLYLIPLRYPEYRNPNAI
ncbi:hypothetical protein D1AOALGA4SA_10716 [Olavius algarvensis Delta 1 endosymbiont]|nr:hypothetical protein D1AOALGA4SA_10716 [Olavius algarvensis Delta 1 endosymbiont]